jgi:hypothetical protein
MHAHQLASGFGVVVQILSLGPSGTYIEAEATADGNDINWTTVTDSGSAGLHQHTLTGYTGLMTTNASHTHTVSGNTGSSGSHTHVLSGSTDNAGSGSSFSILPKSLSCNYIIKL